MLHHVTRQIRPAMLDRCVAFYALLGFEQVPVPAGIAGRATWLERLASERYEVEPRPQHWGSPRSYVRDPAGNLVELMVKPPG